MDSNRFWKVQTFWKILNNGARHYCFDTSTLEEELECFEGHKKRQKRIEEIKKALQESDCTSPKYCWE